LYCLYNIAHLTGQNEHHGGRDVGTEGRLAKWNQALDVGIGSVVPVRQELDYLRCADVGSLRVRTSFAVGSSHRTLRPDVVLQARALSVTGQSWITGVDQLMIDGEKYQFELIRNVELLVNACELHPEGGFVDADSLCGLLSRVAIYR